MNQSTKSLEIYLVEKLRKEMALLGFEPRDVKGHEGRVFDKLICPNRLATFCISISRKPLTITPYISLTHLEIEQVILDILMHKKKRNTKIEALARFSFCPTFTLHLKYTTPIVPNLGRPLENSTAVDEVLREFSFEIERYGLPFLKQYLSIEDLIKGLIGRRLLRFSLLSAPIVAWFGGRTDLANEFLRKNFLDERIPNNELIPGITRREIAKRCEKLFESSPPVF